MSLLPMPQSSAAPHAVWEIISPEHQRANHPNLFGYNDLEAMPLSPPQYAVRLIDNTYSNQLPYSRSAYASSLQNSSNYLSQVARDGQWIGFGGSERGSIGGGGVGGGLLSFGNIFASRNPVGNDDDFSSHSYHLKYPLPSSSSSWKRRTLNESTSSLDTEYDRYLQNHMMGGPGGGWESGLFEKDMGGGNIYAHHSPFLGWPSKEQLGDDAEGIQEQMRQQQQPQPPQPPPPPRLSSQLQQEEKEEVEVEEEKGLDEERGNPLPPADVDEDLKNPSHDNNNNMLHNESSMLSAGEDVDGHEYTSRSRENEEKEEEVEVLDDDDDIIEVTNGSTSSSIVSPTKEDVGVWKESELREEMDRDVDPTGKMEGGGAKREDQQDSGYESGDDELGGTRGEEEDGEEEGVTTTTGGENKGGGEEERGSSSAFVHLNNNNNHNHRESGVRGIIHGSKSEENIQKLDQEAGAAEDAAVNLELQMAFQDHFAPLKSDNNNNNSNNYNNNSSAGGNNLGIRTHKREEGPSSMKSLPSSSSHDDEVEESIEEEQVQQQSKNDDDLLRTEKEPQHRRDRGTLNDIVKREEEEEKGEGKASTDEEDSQKKSDLEKKVFSIIDLKAYLLAYDISIPKFRADPEFQHTDLDEEERWLFEQQLLLEERLLLLQEQQRQLMSQRSLPRPDFFQQQQQPQMDFLEDENVAIF